MIKLFNRRLAAAVLLVFSSTAWSHSAMFPDSYKFDESNSGDLPPNMQSMVANLQAATLCEGGSAAGYPCNNIDLMSFVAKGDMGGGSANLNDIWGYSDPQTGAEIAIVGRTNGTSFVDVTTADAPVYLGFLPSHNNGSDSWRDIKVYNDHAFVVADGSGNSSHGLQVFDLRTLRNLSSPGQTFSETAHMDGFGNAHNIVINEDSGYAYIVGSNQCSGGLYAVDISDPNNPQYAGCFSSDGYTHDAQCVIYGGPDSRYSGREICVGYNEDTITIVDVTDKFNPLQLSRTLYQGSQYTHQGWFLDDTHSILIMNDELDESRNGHNTTSYIYDVSNLESAVELGRYVGPTTAIDHNLYTKDGYVYESNYRAGLRILDAANIASGSLSEVAYFDTIPNSDSAQFSGTWSNYAYFASGNVIMSDIGNGLFTVRPDWDAINDPGPTDPEYCSAASNNASEEWVSQVDLASFSNSSGSATYSDFTAQMVNLTEGANSVSLTPDFGGSSYGEYWKIWIDLNSDGDFDDSGEEVFSSGGTSSSTVSGTLTLPAGSEGVTTRLRIAMRYNAAPVPCGSFNYGEVEDYSVTIGTGGGGGDGDPLTYSNTGSYSIPDNNATGISSPIDVDRSGASESLSVSVDISHTYIGDLEIDLLAPDGAVFNLHNRSGGSANDIVKTYTLDAGTTESSGQWSLRVRDRAAQDVGTINQWSLTFQ